MTSESNTTEAKKTGPLAYKVGDELTIMRGIHRGKVAKVMGVDENKRQYATQLTSGEFVVINEVNTKPPQEGKVEATKLADLVGSWMDSDGDAAALVSLLSANVDGFAKAYNDGGPAAE